MWRPAINLVDIVSLSETKITSKQEWERVQNSLSLSLEQDHELEVVKRVLLLSYYDLPYYLKICLLDMSIFPEDYEIDRLRPIWRWMAEGFIIEQRGQSLEDTGENYISELINRNMIEVVDIDYSGRPRGGDGGRRACPPPPPHGPQIYIRNLNFD